MSKHDQREHGRVSRHLTKLTVHMIGNAHIDPVWMWPWPAGLDEALNTCRTFCDLLDTYPEFQVTRGEAWVYEQVRRLDPALFARIKAHVASGRWGVVNGWWVQPDVNLPTAASLVKQGLVGRAWFREHLGVDVTVGYQVDSFGHNANLPALLRRAGLTAYVFGRPERTRWPLPAELFTWRAPAGEAVTVQRLPLSYCARSVETIEKHLAEAIAQADRRVGHVMCFYGIGDHGGGPAREQIEWILAHRDYQPDVRLIFSHPEAFFRAVAASGVALPEYAGEMQFVEPGTYAVLHEFKQTMRRAEVLVARAEALQQRFPAAAPADAAASLDAAWKALLFNQFHDTLSGTSIAGAYEDARDEVGAARAAARRIMVDITRRQLPALPPAPEQRLLLFNTADRPFRGLVELEPWFGAEANTLPVALLGADGRPLPVQKMPGRAAEAKMFRYLAPLELAPFATTVLRVRHEALPPPPAALLCATPAGLRNNRVEVDLCDTGIAALRLDGRPILGGAGLRLTVQEDLTDTWGGGPDAPCFRGREKCVFRLVRPWDVLATGPLRAVCLAELAWERSRAYLQVQLDAGETCVRLELHLVYGGAYEIVKLPVSPAFVVTARRDGIPGADIARPLDGAEYPVQDFLHVAGDGLQLALVSPDVYSADVQPDGTLRPTLLRTPCYVHNANFPGGIPDPRVYPLSGQGSHEYRLSLLPGTADLAAAVADEAYRLTDPVWMAECTAGMRPRYHPGR